MNCPECGKSLTFKKKQTYVYRECGLEDVTISGIRTLTCSSCNVVYPEIPNVIGLHELISSELVKKPSPLTGPEFRFLRKEIGLKAKELAGHLGTTDVTISRWETGTNPVHPAADRLVRAFFSLRKMQSAHVIEPKSFVAGVFEQLRSIRAEKKARPLRIEIPASRFAAAQTA